MISYKPFWDTLKRKNISTYQLVNKLGVISGGTLHRLRNGEAISTVTIDRLCRALGCGVEDIIRFEKNKSAKG